MLQISHLREKIIARAARWSFFQSAVSLTHAPPALPFLSIQMAAWQNPFQGKGRQLWTFRVLRLTLMLMAARAEPR
jgi:hypothetical protein